MGAGAPHLGAGFLARVFLALLTRPSLWPIALVQARRLVPRDWWRRPPLLPLPDRTYLRFRLQTMYGGQGRAPTAGEVVAYLRWCRDFPRNRPRAAR